MIFDTHAHYTSTQYDEDRESRLASINNNGVKRIVEVGAEIESIPDVLSLADSHDYIYASVGVHPDEIVRLKPEDIGKLESWARNPKVVAVGEIGLDYFEREGEEPKDHGLQKQWFESQLNLARKLNKPVIIHSRDACQDTLDILKNYKDVSAVMHCYSYSKETARELLDMGLVFGVGGVVTFKNAKKLKEAVEYIPMESILLETDCPYMAPTPYRGTRNQSDYIKLVIEAIAEIKQLPCNEVEEICWNNACRFYGLPQ